MASSSIDGFSVLSPSQKKEQERLRKEREADIERQRREEEAREAAQKAEAERKSQEAARRAREAAEKLKAEEAAARQSAARKKVFFWILGFVLTALVIWGACKLSSLMLDLDGGMIFLVAIMWVLIPFVILGIWAILKIFKDLDK